MQQIKNSHTNKSQIACYQDSYLALSFVTKWTQCGQILTKYIKTTNTSKSNKLLAEKQHTCRH